MEIFWRLFLAHFLADFTLQTNWISRIKKEKTLGMVLHILIHLVVTYILVFPYLSVVWFNFVFFEMKGYMVLILICFIHFMIDQLKIYLTKNGVFPDNTISFLVDQLFHLYFIFIFTPFDNVATNFAGERIIMFFSFLALVSHTTTVLIYYLEKDIFAKDFPNFDQKYFMIFERVVLFSLFFVEDWWFFLVPLWIFQLYYLKLRRIVDITNLNFYLSIFISIILGLVARYYFRCVI